MATLKNYPNVTPWRDRHGRTRYRYRRGGKTVYLPGEPFSIEFDEAYEALVAGRPITEDRPARPVAQVVRISTAEHPRSMAAAWEAYQKTSLEWKACNADTRSRQTRIAEEFLLQPVSPGAEITWGKAPISDLKRRHIKMILGEMQDRPFAAKALLVVIKKMIEAAIDEEWIEADPTHLLKFNPATIRGHRAWTDEERARFEAHWPVGTVARLVFETAFWLGNRRGDVVNLRWDQRGGWLDKEGVEHDVFRITQGKTGKPMVLPISPQYAAILAQTERKGDYVVMTTFGTKFSSKSLTGRMRQWTKAAGLPPGCVIHGLRKTLGRVMTENDVTTRQAMEMLGHSNIQHVELYSRDASQARLAVQAMEKVATFEKGRKRRG